MNGVIGECQVPSQTPPSFPVIPGHQIIGIVEKTGSEVNCLKPGDKVTVSGPYGEFFLKDNDNEMMFIGGGAGMAPMRSHLFHLFHTVKETNKNVTFWYGARSWKEVFYYVAITKNIVHPRDSRDHETRS